MDEIIKQALAELRSIHNIIHGPEIWIVFPVLMAACLISAICGFCVFSRWNDDDD